MLHLAWRTIGLKQFDGGRSSVGRAPDCDSGGRGFNPRRPPHLLLLFYIIYKIIVFIWFNFSGKIVI